MEKYIHISGALTVYSTVISITPLSPDPILFFFLCVNVLRKHIKIRL